MDNFGEKNVLSAVLDPGYTVRKTLIPTLSIVIVLYAASAEGPSATSKQPADGSEGL